MNLEDDWTMIDKNEDKINSHLIPNDFDDLCRIPRVCKRWHKVSSNNSLWKSLYLSEYPEPQDTSYATYKDLYFKKKNRIFLPGSGNSISLVLDRDVFVSSVPSQLSGRILLRLKSPTNVYGLYLNLKGSEIGYQRRADGKYDYKIHEYFNSNKSIKGTTPWNKTESFILDSGNYSFPFSFSFPLYGSSGEQLQPTFRSDGRHEVTYAVNVCLSLKNWFSDLTDEKKLLVLGHYDLQDELSRFGAPVSAQNAVSLIGSGNISFRVRLPSSVHVLPANADGQGTIPVTVDIINESGSTVQKVSVWLLRRTAPTIPTKMKDYVYKTETLTIVERKTLPSTSFPLNAVGHSRLNGTTFQFPINSQTVVPSIRYGKLFEVTYWLHVKFHLSYLLTLNPGVAIPITIVGDT